MPSDPILAIDLGTYKSVACASDRATAAAADHTVPTSRAELERLIRATRPAVVVIEACTPAGWVAGVAPFAADSGRRRGERHIRGGRREVRRALYMGALAVARVPGPLRDFAERLKRKGKPSKVALIAVARKLLVIANEVIRDGRAWDPKMAPAA